MHGYLTDITLCILRAVQDKTVDLEYVQGSNGGKRDMKIGDLESVREGGGSNVARYAVNEE